MPYPQSPVGLPADFTKPGKSYKKQVWIASAGIISFVLLYLGLSTWLLYKSYKLFGNTFSGGRDGVLSFIMAMVTGFLGIFMIKAIFFITKRDKTKDIEVKPEEEPQLFAFIYRIADEAKAPRPHKVFISDRVNAGVFYDISFINLFFPTRKNLEIGLGLVNTLNLGEFKSILAHEFGHFTQRSMIIGRWVYIAHRVAYQIVAKRDGLDEFLSTLSGLDFRIAWIGWLLSILVWSIRAVSETFFELVVITERALSREMEFNADLVAVSLSGSDALVSSLYKLHAADEAYDEAIEFVNRQMRLNKQVSDIFLIQENSIVRMREVLNNPAYGATPEITGSDRAAFRVFKEQIAQTPKMWSTHPSNIDREKHIKAVYIASEEDRRSSWILFKDPAALKHRITMLLYKKVKKEAALLSAEEGLTLHNEAFRRSFLLPQYRGLYFNRPVSLAAKTVEAMYGAPVQPGDLSEQWSALYPPSLQQELERLRNLEEELAMLEGLHKEELDASDGRINYRGREISRRELPEAMEQTREEAGKLRKALEEHDRFCRSLNAEAAKTIGRGWPEYLKAVAGLLHFAEHSAKNMEELNRHYMETLSVAVKIRNISSSEMLPLLRAANDLHDCLSGVYAKGSRIRVSGRLLEKMGGIQPEGLLEPFQLGVATAENINSWIGVVQGWVGVAYTMLQTLREAALDELLYAESCVQRYYKAGGEAEEAPELPQGDHTYSVYDPSVKREVNRKLDLFSRFYNAEGLWPTVGRLAVSAAIIVSVVLLSFNIGRSVVIIYNGLPVDVIVNFAGKKHLVVHGDHEQMEVDDSGKSRVNTTTVNGEDVEHFVADVSDDSKTYIYNIAGAAVIYQAYVYYGYQGIPGNDEPKLIGARRWFTYRANYYFEEPPQSISLPAGSTEIRTYLTAYLANPDQRIYALTDSTERSDLIVAHALWEDQASPDILSWLYLLPQTGRAREVLQKRLAQHPNDVAALRLMQEMAEGEEKKQVCAQQQEMYRKDPGNPDLYYLSCRCMEDEAAKDKAFVDGHEKWPGNKWLTYASSFCYVETERWEKALANFSQLINTAPEFSAGVAEEMKRVSHLLHKDKLTVSISGTTYLDYLNAADQSTEQNDPHYLYAFKLLREGKINEAVKWCRADSSVFNHLLPLAAVSDGAGPGLIQEVMSVPMERYRSRMNMVALIYLCLKHQLPIEEFRPEVASLSNGKDKEFYSFVDFVKAGNTAAADALLYSMNAEMKGKCSLLGVLLLGNKAPDRWQVFASALLFDIEKPYRKAELSDWKPEAYSRK